jgi:hypothetical protein
MIILRIVNPDAYEQSPILLGIWIICVILYRVFRDTPGGIIGLVKKILLLLILIVLCSFFIYIIIESFSKEHNIYYTAFCIGVGGLVIWLIWNWFKTNWEKVNEG